MPDLAKSDAVSERILGWGAVAAGAIEFAAPTILAIDVTGATWLLGAGFLLATGRASMLAERVRRALR
jgi:hypothetical protein